MPLPAMAVILSPLRLVSIKRRMSLALLFLLCCTIAAAYDFPPLTGRVVDQADLLSEAAETELTAQLAKHEQQTTNQVVVATVNSLEGGSIDDYGVQLGRFWGIGQREKDNGVLLLIAPNERKMRIDVGYGLEGTLTDAISAVIIDRSLRPAFRAGDFEGGIKGGVDGILDVLNNDMPEDLEQSAADSDFRWIDKLIPFMFFLFVISQFFRRGKSTLVPAAMFGTVGGTIAAAISSSLLVGAIAGAILFFLIFAMKGGGGGGGISGGRGGFSRSRSSWSSGGGFSGGGGSFGGGGSSGGW
jgi:uncharacterized protein